jgi:hypothetical protein
VMARIDAHEASQTIKVDAIYADIYPNSEFLT